MASIIKCVQGHFYDSDKSKECPYCNRSNNENDRIIQNLPKPGQLPGQFEYTPGDLGEERTVAKIPDSGDIVLGSGGRGPRMEGMRADDENVTIGLFSKAAGTAYVTGWLVGLNGAVKGRDYRIMHGKNWVGRSYNMDIIINEDVAISREKQCMIIYDGKGNHFYIQQGKGTVTYLNGTLVEAPQELKIGDTIEMGNCKFEFIPFCREGHTWEEKDIKVND